MKQLLQNIRSGETIIAEVPIPTPTEGTALVRTAASLVSAGTERMVVEFAEKSLVGKARSRPDLVRQVVDKAQREGMITTVESALNRLDQPLPLGYSSAGTIIEIGEGFKGYQIGQRVACAGGGYAVHAEYNLIPQNLLAPLPGNVDFESAAFTTLGAIALHGFRLAQTQLNESVAVIGLGLLGLLTASLAKAAGCRVLGIDIDASRVDLASQLEIEATLREDAAETAQSFTSGRGCDAILICADTPSNDPVEFAGVIARDRAHVVAIGAVGLNIPRKLYFEKELSFINSRSYGPGRYDPTYEEKGHDYAIGYVRWTEGRNLEAFIDLVSSGHINVEHLITHRFSIEQAPAAYDLITGKHKEPFLGVLITYPEATQHNKSLDERRSITRRSEFTPPHSPVSLGVLGAGNFASAVLLPSIKKIPDLQLTGIASASGLNAQHAADKFNFLYATSDDKKIIDDQNVNTIAILTRHNLHAKQVISALEAGKHVFCEKPLAITPNELNAIETALISANPECLLMVGFNRRFAPFAIKLKKFIDARTEPLIAHYRVNAGYLPQTHWLHDPKIGGGRIIGEGCHFIDFLVYLVGDPPISVSAQALPDNGRYNEDNVIMTFRFPDGSLGTISYLANGDKSFPKEHLEVFSGGRIAVLNDFRTLQTIHNGRREVKQSRLRQDKGHRAEWEAFKAAIITGSGPPIPYSQTFGTMNATFAAVQSLHSGKQTSIIS
jgi:predicted dehydrogenase